MNREQYLQLVQRSQSFTTMDPDLQQKILNATGDDMVRYAQIFLQEDQMVQKAAQTLTEKDVKVLKDFDQEVKGVNHEHLVKVETASKEEDDAAAENLLKNL
jgi:hypothetical protein